MIDRKTLLRQQIRTNAIAAGNDPDTGDKIDPVKPGIQPVIVTPPKEIKPSDIVKKNKKKKGKKPIKGITSEPVQVEPEVPQEKSGE